MNISVRIPDNEYGIKPGSYTINQLVTLLRLHSSNPDAIQFIADMMEE